MKKINKKSFPKIKSDKKAEEFVTKADLVDYNFSKFKKVDFELLPKSRPVSLRLPESLYKIVQKKAKSKGIKTQKFIRSTLEKAVS
ncbi:MAG: CopG family antitoxin [Candidatus Paceibacteria bacterium]